MSNGKFADLCVALQLDGLAFATVSGLAVFRFKHVFAELAHFGFGFAEFAEHIIHGEAQIHGGSDQAVQGEGNDAEFDNQGSDE
jgi:hypothetical protein